MGLKQSVKATKYANNAAFLNTVMEYVSEGVVVTADNGDVIYSNELGKAIMDAGLFGPIDIVSRNYKTLTYKGMEYKSSYRVLPHESGIKGIVAILTNASNDAEQTKELAETREELKKAYGFKSAFLANMSHEIRTPIHAIIGFSEMILKQNIDDKVKEEINMIKDSSYSLLAIINDVLDLSKIESGKLELVNVNYYISYIIRDIEATYSLLAARKNLKFNMHLDDDIPSYLHGDKIRLRGALLNILNNAVKYTNEGRIDFSIKVLEKKNDVVTLSFEVKDTGIGIKREDIPKLFESFARFDIEKNYSVEGRGLGLSIAKGYLDLMGGKIEVTSEYGVGSTFSVIVDQQIVDASPVDMKIVNARKNKENKALKVHDYRALVVDDNPLNLKVADGLMKTYGLLVDKASGGKEAIDLCMNNEYNIIFMDQMMPEVDGIMAMKSIRKISDYYRDECIIIVLTADAMAGVRDRLLKEGFDEYISKPLEIHRLEAMLKRFVPEKYIEGEKTEREIPAKQENIPESPVKMTDDQDLSSILGIAGEILDIKIKDCGGRREDYLSELKKLCDTAPSRMENLEESFKNKDYDRYMTQMHSLKGILGTVGNVELSERARVQENAIKDGEYEVISGNMNKFIADLDIFVKKANIALSSEG